jgi:hypothetical protein
VGERRAAVVGDNRARYYELECLGLSVDSNFDPCPLPQTIPPLSTCNPACNPTCNPTPATRPSPCLATRHRPALTGRTDSQRSGPARHMPNASLILDVHSIPSLAIQDIIRLFLATNTAREVYPPNKQTNSCNKNAPAVLHPALSILHPSSCILILHPSSFVDMHLITASPPSRPLAPSTAPPCSCARCPVAAASLRLPCLPRPHPPPRPPRSVPP